MAPAAANGVCEIYPLAGGRDALCNHRKKTVAGAQKLLDRKSRSWLICNSTTKTDKVFLPWQIEIMEFSMSGNVIENDIDFDEADSSVVGELLYTPDNPRDARRLVEDKLEEMRLRRELMDYQLDF